MNGLDIKLDGELAPVLKRAFAVGAAALLLCFVGAFFMFSGSACRSAVWAF